tara:strand:- start:8669 stop:9709 length:1041 start_codon:yes stop_codon:yes gene_type:complete
MARVKYAIAGHPVAHSLSPLLLGLVVSNLEKFGKNLEFTMKQTSVELVETSSIEDALGWGYAGHSPHVPEWVYTGAPFGKYRTDALLKRAIDSAMEIEDSDPRLSSDFEARLTKPSLPSNESLLRKSVHHLPTQCLEQEVWLSLTSPLKHQLSSEAVSSIDDSMDIQAVNALRWDGQGWWCAGVDGLGVASIARYHGVVIETGALLGLRGGGGAARATADAWLKAGGNIRLFPGKRLLELPVDVESDESGKILDFAVDFDGGSIVPASFESCLLQLNPRYQPMVGDFERRVEHMLSTPFDGRWMLAAQHLEAWSRLWAPQYADFLPSLGLLLTQLLHAEKILFEHA